MSNFDVFLADPAFVPFVQPAIKAEAIFSIDTAACVISCRRCLEAALKWMYSVDDALEMPGRDSLIVLLNQRSLKDLVGEDLWRRLDAIRRLGNLAAHEDDPIPRDKAALCLENLYVFLDFVAYCYSTEIRTGGKFDPSLLDSPAPSSQNQVLSSGNAPAASLQAENELLKAELTARRQASRSSYFSSPLSEISPESRQLYVDTLMIDAGWVLGKNWKTHVALSETDSVDSLLYGNDSQPLALVEWQKTSISPSHGRYRALRQADLLEKQSGIRPLVFLTDGFHTRLLNDAFEPERTVSGLYSPEDLQRLFSLQQRRKPLSGAVFHPADRAYQRTAIRSALCAFEERLQRRCLLSMAPGTGKTRVALGVLSLLHSHFWAQNVLFLCENTALLEQIRRQLSALLPDISVVELSTKTQKLSSPFVLSTGDMLLRRLDHLKTTSGSPLSCGHFDLIICDEATSLLERSGLLDFFDARCLALTDAPPSSISAALYGTFEMGQTRPTFAYSFFDAVQDRFILPFLFIEARLRSQEQGITLAQCSPQEQEALRKAFPSSVPEHISPEEVSVRILNRDSLRESLGVFMQKCQKADDQNTIGKTIFFSSGRRQAKLLLSLFQEEYPHLANAIALLDHSKKQAAGVLQDFARPDHPLRIVISLQMMDSGIDIPEIVNLAFFRSVSDSSRFLSMIGRGCRLCPHLSASAPKTRFTVFDFAGNARFLSQQAQNTPSACKTLEGTIFSLKAQIAYQLNSLQPPDSWYTPLVLDLCQSVQALDKSLLTVQLHRRQVETLSRPEAYQQLTFEELLELTRDLAPLIPTSKSDANVLRTDILFYEFILSRLRGTSDSGADLAELISALASSHACEVRPHAALLKRLQSSDELFRISLSDLDQARRVLRTLVHLVPAFFAPRELDLDDEVLSVTEHDIFSSHAASKEVFS